MMQKVAIIGSAGAGKSTLAKQLGSILNLPVYHLDRFFWKPGWVPTEKADWDAFLSELVKKDLWIIDGNYGRTFDIRFQEADTIIYLDMSTLLTIYRIIKRRIMYHGKTRPDLNEGCPEKLDWEFIKWVWKFNKEKRKGILQKLENLNNEKHIYILKNRREVSAFLDTSSTK